jgi:hypothetical protein
LQVQHALLLLLLLLLASTHVLELWWWRGIWDEVSQLRWVIKRVVKQDGMTDAAAATVGSRVSL